MIDAMQQYNQILTDTRGKTPYLSEWNRIFLLISFPTLSFVDKFGFTLFDLIDGCRVQICLQIATHLDDIIYQW